MESKGIPRADINSLEWAIYFSRLNLVDLRKGDWLNIKEELYDFLDLELADPSGIVLPPKAKEDFMEDISVTEVYRIQETIRADLLDYSAKDGRATAVILHVQGIDFAFVSWSPEHAFQQLMQAENYETSARLALGMRLQRAGITQAYIRKCPECDSLFLMKRKPRKDVANHYCSTKCSTTAAGRNYRRKHAATLKKRERERSKRRYEESIRALYPNAPVKGKKKVKGHRK